MSGTAAGYRSRRKTISIERHDAMGLAIELAKRGLRATLITWETGIEISATRQLFRQLQDRKPPSGSAPQAYTIISSRVRLIDASLSVLLYKGAASEASVVRRDLDVPAFIHAYDTYHTWKSHKLFPTECELLSVTEMWRLVTDWLIGEARLVECRSCRVYYLIVREQHQPGCPFC